MSSTSSLCRSISFIFLVFCLVGVQSEEYLARSVRLSTEKAGSGGANVCAGFARPGSCSINCFRADPVCGADGVTYWCGCPDAACHGARVVRTGACDAGNAGSASVPGQALLLVHIVWLFLLGFSVLFGLF